MDAKCSHSNDGLILVVDDEPLVRMEAVSMLEHAGYQVIEASSSADAMRQLASNRHITMILTDVHMAGTVDGMGLAHAVNRLWPRIAITVMSGVAHPNAHMLPAKARFVTKPFDERNVMTAIRQSRVAA